MRKKNVFRKMLSILLATSMVMSTAMPTAAAEAETESTVAEYTVDENGNLAEVTDEETAETAAEVSETEETAAASEVAEASSETETSAETTAEETQYILLLPEVDGVTYEWDEEYYSEDYSDEESNVLLYNEGDEVKIEVHTELEMAFIDAGTTEEFTDFEEEDSVYTFLMPAADLYVQFTDTAETEAVTEAVPESETTAPATESETADTSAEEEISVASETEAEITAETETEAEEESYGWIEYVAGEGGSISASFEYMGLIYDEGMYTYDMMEYGPWEAQYETTGSLTVTATADSGYEFDSIVLTDGDGNEIATYDTESVTVTPDADTRIVIMASFTATGEEAESETESEEDSNDGIMTAASETRWAIIDKNFTVYYSTYGFGTGHTSQYKVKTTITNENTGTAKVYTRNGYCINPSKGSPDDNTKTITKLKDSGALARVLYYTNSSYSGDDCFWTVYGYDDWDTEKKTIIIHIAAAYAYGDSDWDYGANSTATSYAMQLYNYAKSMPELPDAEMSFSKESVDASVEEVDGTYMQVTPSVTFSASYDEQTITIDLPDEVYMVYKESGQSTVTSAAGEEVTITAGTKFHFVAPVGYSATNGTSWTFTVKGSMTKDYSAYKVAGADGTQDLAIVLALDDSTDAKATLTVNWVDLGEVKLIKDSDTPEITDGNDMYDLTGITYTVYTDAECTTPATMYVTDSEGTVSQLDAELVVEAVEQEDHTFVYETNTATLAVGTYYVKETLADSSGYWVDETVYPVTVSENTTTIVNADELTGEGTVSDSPIVYDVSLIITKTTDAETDKSLAGAVFEMKFYAGASDASGEVSRTWYFQSDADGNVSFGDDLDYYLTTGDYVSDPLYYDTNDVVKIPLGYLQITEVKPPEGFNSSSDVISYSFTADGWAIYRNGVEEYSDNTSVTIENEQIQDIGYIEDIPIYGGVSIDKKDWSLDAEQGDASLAGFTFDVINMNDYAVTLSTDKTTKYSKGETVLTLTTDENGHTESGIVLQYGTYKIVETGQGTGYTSSGNGTTQEITITEQGEVQKCTVTNKVKEAGISLQKVDRETGKAESQGGGTLKGATFAIINASETSVENADGAEIPTANGILSDTPTSAELRELADEGTYTVQEIVTNDTGFASTGSTDLPYGTYYVVEIESSTGYWIDEDFVGKAVIRTNDEVIALGTTDGDSTFIDIYNEYATTVEQPLRRFNLEFQKVDIDGVPKAYIPFLISAITVDSEGHETVVETHVVVSDENGYVNTSRTHSENTNGFDQYVVDGVVTAEGEALLEEASTWGVWFGSLDALDDENGALYGCYYRITEIQCEDNSGRSENLLESELLNYANESGDNKAVLSDDDTEKAPLYTYHPLVDTEIVLTSSASDADSSTHSISLRKDANAEDEVSYTHVSSDHTYRMETKFVDITDGNRMLKITGTDDTDAAISDDGYWVTKEFQPEKKSTTNNTYGSITMQATFDTTGLNGHTIVAVDYLYEYINGNWVLVAKHEDYTDEDQMLYVPDIHTNAVDGLTDSRVGTVSDGDYIVDTVTYSNLASKTNYVLVMYVADAETGEAVVKNDDGTPYTVTRRIFSNTTDSVISGTRVMPQYAIDASGFDGRTLVVVESLYLADEDDNPYGDPVISNTSIADEDETIRYPEVHTTASDSETGDDVGTSSDVATIYDEVVIENVIFDDNDLDGKYTYTVTGELVYQQDCTDVDGVSHKAGDTVETLDGTQDTVTIVSDAAGNATFTYADGTTAEGKVTITAYGQNVSKTVNGGTSNEYVVDTTAAIATVTVQLIYKVNTSKLEGCSTVVFEDLSHNDVVVASHADITDEAQTIHIPEVHTSAAMDSTGDDVGEVAEDVSITDTVILENLVPGRTYTVSGKLVDQETGKDILVDGKTVTQTATITVGEGTITASNGEKTTVTAYDDTYNYVNGTVDLVFTFDASALAGETVVVFEDLIHNGVTVACHADLKDEGQTIHFPEIQTTAADGYTEDAVGTVSSEAVIVDTVIYTNLVPGRTYTVSGILMDKATGDALLDAEGSTITAERTFTAGEVEDGITATVDEETNSVSGTVDITFTFDGSLLEGTTVVAFEDLEHNGITVTTHSDLDDEDETVHFPKVRTSAIDGNVGDEVGMVNETFIVDTVSLWNLVPGMTYTVSGILMDKETGEELIDATGSTVTQTADITVNEDGTVTAANGEAVTVITYDADNNYVDCTVELIFTLDASTLAGMTTVVFEDLQHNGVTVASHADINDLGQSVHFPEIHTTATDFDTSDHVGTVEEEAVIEDVVYYTNLVVGKEYTLTGTLMNRETGTPLLDESGNTITASATFTAAVESDDENNTVTAYHEDNNSVDGTYLITFTLDSSLLAGKTVVAFESLYHNGVEVTTHADISDNDQSIYYPDIHTTAVDSNTGDHVGSIWGALINFVRKALGQDVEEDAKQVITDTVALSNLVPGMTYVVSGKLYNVTESLEAGENIPLTIDGEEITQAVTITVSEDGSSITAADGSKTSVTAYNSELNSVDGTVDLVYTLDSSKIQGIKLVVFETLYQDVTYTPETNPEEVPEEDKVNEHSDLEDEGQSVSEVSIHTTAVDTATGDHVGSVPDGTSVSVIHDTVNLAGLVEGMEYTIDGVLVSLGDSDFSAGTIYYLKADGTLTTDRAEAYTETYTFTAGETSETHYLNFSITSDKVQGKSLTVFENISHNGTVISSHPAGDGDGWDEEAFSEQTVYYPAGKTNATDTATGEHMSLADENRTIVDRVYFENLIAGQEYTITGQLVYKEAFTDADGVSHAAGEAVTDAIPVTFTATADMTAAYYADGTTAAVDSVTAKTLADGTVVVSGYVSINFTVNASKMAGATLVAFESFSHNGADIFTHNDLNDLPETIKIPAIHTTASVLDLDEAAIYDENGNYIDITITDTVKYENLWTAAELASMKEQAKYIEYLDGTYRTQDSAIYTVSEDAVYMLKGVLMDKSTGEALVDSNGNTYTVYSEAFTPESEDGSYDVKFVINAGDFLDEDGETKLAGATLVVYEDLYLAATKAEATEDNHVAEHHDIDDVDQDIRIPDGKTHATDGASDVTITEDVLDTMDSQHEADSTTDHEADATESMTITDLVGYENLHGGTTYTATGTLQVVTETDENGTPTAWEVAVDDNGNAVTATAEFTTDGSYEDSVSGTVTLTFTFSGVSLAGKTLVAFETVSREGVAVFVHADITDEAQTIYVPGIGTQAADALSGLDETVANSTTWILDTVSYENLEKGKEYTLSGILYDDIEGTTLGDTQVTGTFIAGEDDQIITSDGTVIMTKDELVEFLGGAASATTWKETASSEPVASTDITYSSDKVSGLTENSTGQGNRVSGEVYLLIEVDTSELGGHTVVVFEDLYAADSTGVLKQVASHEDAEDEAQSVNIPLVQTSATVADGEKSVVSGGVETVVDVVSYYNLTPGREYKVRGLLMDKTTGESTEVTAETTFTPDEADGTITLEFEVDTKDLAGHELVVFEELLTKDEDGNAFIVGEHKDLDDASQTVLITAPAVAAVQTGDNLDLLPALIILLVVVLLIVLGILLSRKKKGAAAPVGDEPETKAPEAESVAADASENEEADTAEPEKPEE